MAIEMNFEEFDSMINNIIGGICFLEYENNKLTPIFVNDGFYRMLGYSKSKGQKYMKNIRRNVIPEDLPILEQAIEDVLKDDGSVDVEFRTVTADGGLRWIHVRGNLYSREGTKYTIVTMVQDITEKKSIDEELHQQAERLNILFESQDERIVDYNAKSDVLVVRTSGRYESTGELIIDKYIENAVSDRVFNEDRANYIQVWERLLKSPGHAAIEFRTNIYDEDYLWYQVNLTSLLGTEGYVTRVVGRLVNIHDKKMEEMNLKLRAKRDALTRLHEEDAAAKLIQIELMEEIEKDTLNALMILDLDNFKRVYDVFGQAQCDRILADVGVYLDESVKGSDVVGRIDIDRFVIYVKNIQGFSDAQKLASEIVKKINFTLPGDGVEIHVTCSVGVAMFPYHGVTYDELYEKANRAITRVKASGKYGYRIYDAASTMAYHALRKNNNIAYDPEKGMHLNWNIEDMVMQILFEDKVMEDALHMAIELIAVHYGFHRGFIVSNEKGSLPLSKQVNFSRHGYEMGTESKEHFEVRRVVYEFLYESFKNCSVIHEYDVVVDELRYYFQSEGIKSLLYYPITANGEFLGAIIFENHEDIQLEFEDSVMEEIRSLFRILEAHVLQIGLMDRLQDFATQIEMMDSLDSYVYIVNVDTYELSFVNRKALMQLPDVKVGDLCYKAFQHRDTPCESCLFSKISREETHARHTEEMFNYSLRCWCRCSASWLVTKAENALGMLNFIDISEYFIG
ncbi:MAG: diguanylate cyclase [Lachnospiraceae bacterium]|nr:diguanylate cyclase [Lachnospiraceae bacterium]